MTKTQKDRLKRILPNNRPKYVRVYDNGGESFDRYTVVFTGRYPKTSADGRKEYHYVGLSTHPFSPQGFCSHESSRDIIDTNKNGWPPAVGRKNHLGKRIIYDDLPEDCQKVVLEDYKELWNLN